MKGGLTSASLQAWHERQLSIMSATRDAENAEIRAMVGPADRTRWPDPKADAKTAIKAVWDPSLNDAVNLRNKAIAAAGSSSGGYDATRMAQVREHNASRARLDAAKTPWVGRNIMRSVLADQESSEE